MRPTQDHKQVYADFWKELVEVDGELSLERVERELSDFKWVLDNVPLVYGHITGYATSNIRVIPDQVIALADESYEESTRSDLEDILQNTPDAELRTEIAKAYGITNPNETQQ